MSFYHRDFDFERIWFWEAGAFLSEGWCLTYRCPLSLDLRLTACRRLVSCVETPTLKRPLARYGNSPFVIRAGRKTHRARRFQGLRSARSRMITLISGSSPE